MNTAVSTLAEQAKALTAAERVALAEMSKSLATQKFAHF
jgi:hypothetical protein